MAKIHVSFDLKTSESSQTFESKGIRKDNTLTFHDEEGFKHQIILETNQLKYYKFGESNLVLIFEEGIKHNGSFEIQNHVINFDTQTESLLINDEYIAVNYQLLTDNDVVHTASLELKISMLEEVKHGRS
ncbi:MAG: DUF1934 family protein [Candidatus Izemoplasmataceae bacterium]|jgi:hypothetical protein